MSLTGMHVMAKDYQVRPRERLSAYLRRQYVGPNRDGRLACDIKTSPRTARNLFEDHWPGDETWAAIVRRFGADVLRAVFAPEIAPVLAELHETEARLAKELQSLRNRRREVEGDHRGFAGFVAADQVEAPELNLDLFEALDDFTEHRAEARP